MEDATKIKSITAQILEEFFRRLREDEAIPPKLIENLRRLAEEGKFSDSDAILRVLTAEEEELDAAN